MRCCLNQAGYRTATRGWRLASRADSVFKELARESVPAGFPSRQRDAILPAIELWGSRWRKRTMHGRHSDAGEGKVRRIKRLWTARNLGASVTTGECPIRKARESEDVCAQSGVFFVWNPSLGNWKKPCMSLFPLVPGAPSTGTSMTVTVSPDGSSVQMYGQIAVYPAWEAYAQQPATGAQGTLLQYTAARTSANSPGALLTGATMDVRGRTTLRPPTPPKPTCTDGETGCQ